MPRTAKQKQAELAGPGSRHRRSAVSQIRLHRLRRVSQMQYSAERHRCEEFRTFVKRSALQQLMMVIMTKEDDYLFTVAVTFSASVLARTMHSWFLILRLIT